MRVYFPSVNFRVPVMIISDEDVSPVELHVLRAVAEGIDRLEDLRGLFGLELRPAMEVLNEMLRRNLLVIDFRAGRFHLPRRVAEALRTSNGGGTVGLQQSGYDRAEARELRFCLNRCTGSVSRERRLLGQRDQDQIPFQPERGLLELANLDELEVISVANSLLQREGMRVRDLDLADAAPTREGGLVAEVTCIEWGDGDDEAAATLQFDPRHNVSPRELHELEQALLETRRDQPWLWQRLGARRIAAEEVRVPVATALPRSLWDIAGLLERRGSVELDRIQVREVLDQAETAVRDAERMRVLLGARAVWEAVASLTAGRERQAVLVCPFLTPEGVERMRPALQRPAGRSAPVAVLHGIEATVDQRAAEAAGTLDDVLVDPAVGAQVHAKVAVQDARRTLIATKNFLSSGPDARLFDVAVEIDGGPGTAGALAWAKSLTGRLDWEQGPNRLRWRPDELGAVRRPQAYYPLPPDLDVPDRFTDIVTRVNRELEGDDPPVQLRGLLLGVRAWFDEQQRTRPQGRPEGQVPAEELFVLVRDIADRLEEGGYAPCALVRTVLHRPMMFDALEHARASVVICSHQLSPRPLGPNFRRALTSALDRGVNVVLLWGEEEDRPEDATPSKLPAQLQDLAQDRPGRLLVNTQPLHLHCKLLLVDGTAAVVTSFEFLHFLESPAYRRHELGLWMGSRTVTRSLLDGVREHVRGTDPNFADELDALALHVEAVRS